MYTFDTETCGLHGPITLIQYAKGDDDIAIYSPWEYKVQDTLDLINKFVDEGVIAFNLAFDWFHICQMYTTLLLLDKNEVPDPLKYADAEPEGRDGPCLNPAHAFDVMLHARKGPYQSTMDRNDIRIKRVPRILAEPLIKELEKRVPIPDIYFARAKDKTIRWQLDGDDPLLTDIVLRFKPSSALKTLAVDALGLDETIAYQDILPPGQPYDVGWAPFARAVSTPKDKWAVRVKSAGGWSWRYAWPMYISKHIDHWKYNKLARQYAHDDVKYTRDLYRKFGAGVDDTDSVLAAMVGAVRWRGFKVDVDKIKDLRERAIVKAASTPKAPKQAYNYVTEGMNEVELNVLKSISLNNTFGESECSTSKEVLEELKEQGNKRAGEVLGARKATKEIEIYDKLIQAGRFHASFKVIGTFTTRMSGADGLNAQGIKRSKDVRGAFPLAFDDYVLMGGDFDAFEVSIADKVYDDPELRKQLCTCSACKTVCSIEEYGTTDKCSKCGGERRKIHGLLGQELSGLSYEEVAASKGKEPDWYDKGKRGIFGKFYGGNWQTWVRRLRIDEELAKKADKNFDRRFRGIGRAREKISESFSPLRQPGGLGTRVEWHEPAEYIESIFGFRRYFTLENRICKALFDLAAKLPPAWRKVEGRIVRRDREQKIGGAVMSALYAASFGIQGQIYRAAANHVIQSPGATITKELERRLWELQPTGIHEFVILPLNVHDEIMCPTTQPDATTKVVDEFIEEYRKHVPLLKMGWKELNSWADK